MWLSRRPVARQEGEVQEGETLGEGTAQAVAPRPGGRQGCVEGRADAWSVSGETAEDDPTLGRR